MSSFETLFTKKLPTYILIHSLAFASVCIPEYSSGFPQGAGYLPDKVDEGRFSGLRRNKQK